MNGQKPKISVVVPAYNEERYLPRCLESLNNQTFRDFEVVVVDNNSRDKTAAIAESFGARVVKEPKQGMIHARERGFAEARANIIARTDADTVVAPNWLEVIDTTFKEHPKAVALCGSLLSPTERIPDSVFFDYSEFFFKRMGNVLAGHTLLLGPNMAIRKAAWEKVRVHTNDKQVHEDIDLACHLIEQGTILFVPEMQVVFSFRRLEKRVVAGAVEYLFEYPTRYFRTIFLHHPILKNGKKNRLLSFGAGKNMIDDEVENGAEYIRAPKTPRFIKQIRKK